MRAWLSMGLVSAVALIGCGDDATGMGGAAGMGGSGGAAGAGGSLVAFTEAEVQEVFTNSCSSGIGTGCHSQLDEEGVAAQGMVLDDFATNSLVIDVASNESDLDRIEPGSRQDSYLWHKINGTQNDVGGFGAQMPLGRDPLPDETIERIGLYIDGL